MFRYRPEWTTTGGPGVSTFHFSEAGDPQLCADAARAFFVAIQALLPDDVTIQFPAEMEEVDIPTGELVGTVPVTPPASVAGTAAGAFAAPSGARVRWNTGDIVRGRRVIGTTFLVPLAASAYGNDGTLLSTPRTTIQTAAATFRAVDGNSLGVWSRPSSPGAADGSFHGTISASVPEQVAVLRSRRD